MNNTLRTKRIRNMIILWSVLIVVCAVLFVLARFCGLRIPCIFKLISGLDCPGCGNTRAVIALSQLDFRASLAYNPMLLPELFYVEWLLIYCTKQYITCGSFSYGLKIRVIDILALSSFMVWWIVRNL